MATGDSIEQGERNLWRWVLFSGLLHGALIWSLFVAPYGAPRRAPSYPVYTVELVGGEKLGGTTLGTEITKPPAQEKEIKRPAKDPPKVQAVKKEQRKAVDSKPQVREEVAVKRSKRELKKEAVSQAAPGLPEKVREKLIESAIERVRERTKAEQKREKRNGLSSGPSEGEGAAAAGLAGKGGGITKGIEFLIYYNRMRNLIRERWTWVGKRSDLEVTVRFGIQENGEVFGLKIVQGSGDPSYDESVFRAVSRASPLPPPPESYRQDFRDVELTFRPKDLSGKSGGS